MTASAEKFIKRLHLAHRVDRAATAHIEPARLRALARCLVSHTSTADDAPGGGSRAASGAARFACRDTEALLAVAAIACEQLEALLRSGPHVDERRAHALLRCAVDVGWALHLTRMTLAHSEAQRFAVALALAVDGSARALAAGRQSPGDRDLSAPEAATAAELRVVDGALSLLCGANGRGGRTPAPALDVTAVARMIAITADDVVNASAGSGDPDSVPADLVRAVQTVAKMGAAALGQLQDARRGRAIAPRGAAQAGESLPEAALLRQVTCLAVRLLESDFPWYGRTAYARFVICQHCVAPGDRVHSGSGTSGAPTQRALAPARDSPVVGTGRQDLLVHFDSARDLARVALVVCAAKLVNASLQQGVRSQLARFRRDRAVDARTEASLRRALTIMRRLRERNRCAPNAALLLRAVTPRDMAAWSDRHLARRAHAPAHSPEDGGAENVEGADVEASGALSEKPFPPLSGGESDAGAKAGGSGASSRTAPGAPTRRVVTTKQVELRRPSLHVPWGLTISGAGIVTVPAARRPGNPFHEQFAAPAAAMGCELRLVAIDGEAVVSVAHAERRLRDVVVARLTLCVVTSASLEHV